MAAIKKEAVTYEEILRAVKAAHYAPVYYLMGLEPYYIDKISDYIVDMALKEEEKDFNLTVLYGQDTSWKEVLTIAREYPMMADRRVVLVREAQSLSGGDDGADSEQFLAYLNNPQPSTVLVFCHKHGVLNRKRKIAMEIQKVGVLFESKRLYDNQLPSFVNSYFKRKGVVIDAKAVTMLCDYVGADLSHLSGELDKLVLALPKGVIRITDDHVAATVGMSKDFNNFELTAAIAEKDIYKVNRIIKVFDENPKAHPVPMVISTLFSFFSDIMQAYYAPVRTEEGIADYLGLAKWQVARNIVPAMKKFSGVKVMQIIEKLREADEKYKGIGATKIYSDHVLKDICYFILH